MNKQVRAFLSHSSKDKFFVAPVYKSLTAARVHYDEATFEKGESSAAEIYRAMVNSDVFVLFLSENSIASPWVQTELLLGQQHFSSGLIKKILVFLLDDLDVERIPDWLRVFIYHKTQSPGVISTAIRSALFEISVANNSTLQLFMGRDKELGAVKDKLSDLTDDAPLALFFGGNEGIGRRTLAKRAVKDVHPQLMSFPVEITLGDKEGDVEFFRFLLNQGEANPFMKEIERVDQYLLMDQQGRTDAILSLVEKIASHRQIIFLRGKDSIVNDEGLLASWLSAVISKLTSSSWPKLVIFARRMISPGKRGRYPGVAFFSVNSLELPDSRKLLAIWLKHLQANIDQSLSDEIVQYVNGHPRNIQLAAALAAEFGTARLQTERAEFLDALRQQARALLDGITLDSDREKVLALFREYEYLSPEDLFVAADMDEASLSKTMSYLTEHGIIESDGHYIRLAPYLLDALSRFDWSDSAKGFIIDCRERLLARLEVLTTQDYVRISTIDNGILTALRQNRRISNVLLSRCLLPSHLLRVAREFYDRKEFSKAIELARRALEGKEKLSEEAQIEALRLICLSCVRLGKDDELLDALDILESYTERLASRTAAFVRGFKARYDGKLEIAEEKFRLAYKLGGERNFHILRELAQLAKLKEDFAEAEVFARTAMEIAERNPYIIDTLLEIIIERHKDDQKFLRNNSELQELFERLNESARREKRSFFESRQAHLFASLHETDKALQWAGKAVETTPHHLPVLLTLAKIQLNVGASSDAKRTLDRVSKQIRNAGANVDRRSAGELDKLSVLLNVQENNFTKAREILHYARSLPKSLQASLEKKIDVAEAYSANHR